MDSYTNSTPPLFARVIVKSKMCGPFRATLDGTDVTHLFPKTAGLIPSFTLSAALFIPLHPGQHTFTATADMVGFLPSDCKADEDTANFTVGEPRDTPYMVECRMKGVPIPPDWSQSEARWKFMGEIKSLINPPGGSPTDRANVWAYSDPYVRGACIVRAANDGPGDSFGIICQSATTGAACFWQNEPGKGWESQPLKLSELLNGNTIMQKFGDCTACHRGNNAFLIDPQEPVWQRVMKNISSTISVAAGPTNVPIGVNFTTRVNASPDTRTITLADGSPYQYPRFIPIGRDPMGKKWINPPPEATEVLCSGACHENHKGHIEVQVNGINFPSSRWMPPDCHVGSPANDPSKNCYD